MYGIGHCNKTPNCSINHYLFSTFSEAMPNRKQRKGGNQSQSKDGRPNTLCDTNSPRRSKITATSGKREETEETGKGRGRSQSSRTEMPGSLTGTVM
jgi:hypothetical protein